MTRAHEAATMQVLPHMGVMVLVAWATDLLIGCFPSGALEAMSVRVLPYVRVVVLLAGTAHHGQCLHARAAEFTIVEISPDVGRVGV
jgi:hypothetical protein